MAVLETQEVARPHVEERAVFVTDDDRRARRLRRIALAITVVAFLWLVALGLGMFGFGRLPGLPFVKSGGGSEPSNAPASASKAPDTGWAVRLDTAALAQSARSVSGGAASSAQRSSSGRVTRSVVVQPIAAPAAAPGQTPANPAGRERGWAKNGNPAPPGQVRKAQPPPPPPAHGQGKGQLKKDPAAPPPPVPPGQAKKNPPPPPPPP